MSDRINLAFASGSHALNPEFLERVRQLYPDLPLYVVSEFPPVVGTWIPYDVLRSLEENRDRCRAAIAGKSIQHCSVLMDRKVPHRKLRFLAFLVAPPHRATLFDEQWNRYRLFPGTGGSVIQFWARRLRNWVRFQSNPGGGIYNFFWRLKHPSHFRRPLRYFIATQVGRAAALVKANLPAKDDPPNPQKALPQGISVVIPSRNGRGLLTRLLPGVVGDLAGIPSEIIVVDNGSIDGTAAVLAEQFPQVRVDVDPQPLAFATAVNRGIAAAAYSHVCLLNNDMVLEPNFFQPMLDAFNQVPDLFCATAQILFPPGVRREETGKAVMPPRLLADRSTDFPVRCDEPVPGENLSYVLYGSGGCSLYDAAKLRQVGCFGEMFRPAYVEDLDTGYRGWLRNWPTVYVAAARVVHHHRATTSRYYSAEELDLVLDMNYLRFLMRSVASAATFHRLWKLAIWRLNVKGSGHFPSFTAAAALGFSARAPKWLERPLRNPYPEELILGLGSGAIAVFPGKPRSGRPVVMVVSPYLPFPLSHGGAVRMFNLMRGAAQDFDQVLVCFVEELGTPPAELLEICNEIVLVRRYGSHLRPSTERPDVVEEFDSPAFHGALQQTVRKWKPSVAQLEFTQMAQYAGDCAPAKTIMVEHDVTFDLYQQLLVQGEDWETRRQLSRWERFERAAWKQVNCVVTMSEKDRAVVGPGAVALLNGVDLKRFQPTGSEPEPNRILFIGAFQHLPNLMAVRFFLEGVWPALAKYSPALHIIAGRRPQFHLDRFRDRAAIDLTQPGIEIEEFVSDVRPAYQRAVIVIAPLLASAGTNIKIMEAMAMGKAIVSTRAGINGLDLEPGRDVVVVDTASEMAAAIAELFENPARRKEMEQQARRTAEEKYDWDLIAVDQKRLYDSLLRR